MGGRAIRHCSASCRAGSISICGHGARHRVTQHDLPGYAIGGVAVGEGTEQIRNVVEHTAPLLPRDKPRYLMGVGYERDLLMAVRAGVDMFDCVLPTRNGRNANAFTSTGQIRLKNAKFRDDPRPIEEGCDCLACGGGGSGQVAEWPSGRAEEADRPAAHLTTRPLDHSATFFSRSYIRHLFQAGEMMGPILVRRITSVISSACCWTFAVQSAKMTGL